MRSYCLANGRNSFGIPGVHVPAHLVEDEPVPDGAVLGVVLHVPQVGVRLEVAADPRLHHLVAHPLRAHLRAGQVKMQVR